ncbi:kinase inhibitor [Robbsia andropogonis]|uniref:Kinase inhibitor n=1 Tax=Robbsia andropogonis TaxID=28092 RepID=A0A0F5K1W4_9BURK|nr:YbhB/YbcL family Raf kinase inhibitor-like protein [Robbsia andropogonis]KKB63884.1 kinase inhibitor [Robbsia andropogonis]MCP1116685.1 YbhB/YbcL family Raf kinase inhibitor-like protein [Robbsia andropogonis]MCP1126636.1 YbhB/YbcL family Raf kinase inhibitor-like protein [Robbsia andropogonis]
MTDFRLFSDDFAADSHFGKEQELNNPDFGTNGKNLSPSLRWEGVPSDAQSLALTVYDPDAPTGSGFWHWVVINLPVDTRSLPTDAGRASGDLMPQGATQMLNDYGFRGFGGWAPPKGDKPHRYIFQIHALKVPSLPLPPDATNAVARFMIHLNQVASATLTGYYAIT